MKALVLCCGPSLAAFDGNTAGYDLTIGVNEVVARFPCDWWVFADDVVLDRNIDRLAADVQKLFIKRVPRRNGPMPHNVIRSIEWVEERYWLRWNDLEDWPTTLKQYSGCAALMLAAHKGATEIDVYGVDMEGTSDFEGNGEHAVRDEDRWQAERVLWRLTMQKCEAMGINVRRPANKPLLTSFFTENRPYPEHADRLIAELDALGWDHMILPEVSCGDWGLTARTKPTFILDRCRETEGPVCWLDIDSQIVSEPTQLTTLIGFDVAVVKAPPGLDKCGKFCTAVVWVANNERSRAFLSAWSVRCAKEPMTFAADQEMFEKAMGDVEGLRVGLLPYQYCCIFDLMEQYEPAVIRQLQASRIGRATCNLSS